MLGKEHPFQDWPDWITTTVQGIQLQENPGIANGQTVFVSGYMDHLQAWILDKTWYANGNMYEQWKRIRQDGVTELCQFSYNSDDGFLPVETDMIGTTESVFDYSTLIIIGILAYILG